MLLSEHFTLEEMTRSHTAALLHIANTPDEKATKNLQILCLQVLEPARKAMAEPLVITSGYRCSKLNKAVGGKNNSYHLMGMAADIRINDKPRSWVKKLSGILNDQPLTDIVLVEYSKNTIWMHVQWSTRPRHKIIMNYEATT